MEFDSSFLGAAHIGEKSKSTKTSEDYIGEFNISWAKRVDCKYLFNWDSVPGDDDDKLIRVLMDDFDINWAENATITKSSDGMIINISNGEHSAEIIMDEKKKNAILKISDGRVYDLEVRTENDELKIYDCRLERRPEHVTGEGYVMVDEETSRGQMRLIEHGSGIYSSD